MENARHDFSDVKKLRHLSDGYWDSAARLGVHGAVLQAVPGGRLSAPDGRVAVNMSSYSYLGLDESPRIIDAAIAALRSNMVLNSSLSRVRMTLPLLEEAECALGDLFGADVATLNSCSAAAWATLPVLASGLITDGVAPVMVFDKRAHFCMASLKSLCADETRVETIRHNDVDALADICRKNKRVAYVCDSVYSTGGTLAPLEELFELQEEFGLFLYFDEAHSTSVIGDMGRGYVLDRMGAINDLTMLITSLNKGFGASGGAIVFGPRDDDRKRKIIQRSSGPMMWSQRVNTPALGAIIESAKLHRSEALPELQAKLHSNIALFDGLVRAAGQGNSVPIRYLELGSEADTLETSAYLFDNGFYVEPDFFPIVSRGAAGLRVRIRSSMSTADIEQFAHVWHKLGVDQQ